MDRLTAVERRAMKAEPMNDPQRNRRDFPAPWVRLRQVIFLILFGPILALLGVRLLLHVIADR
jgi:hypothetical protein